LALDLHTSFDGEVKLILGDRVFDDEDFEKALVELCIGADATLLCVRTQYKTLAPSTGCRYCSGSGKVHAIGKLLKCEACSERFPKLQWADVISDTTESAACSSWESTDSTSLCSV